MMTTMMRMLAMKRSIKDEFDVNNCFGGGIVVVWFVLLYTATQIAAHTPTTYVHCTYAIILLILCVDLRILYLLFSRVLY